MAKYDPNEFFSAEQERYPLPMTCPECGKTMRPVHKHRLPDMPRHYFCTFCDAMIPENHPGIRFRKPPTNADRIRAMSNYDLANIIDCPNQQRFNDGCKKWHDCHDCKMEWLEKDASHADP